MITKQEYYELLCEHEYRRRVNPIGMFKNLDMQQSFDDDPSRDKGLFGGNRSGKTEKGAQYVIKKCLAEPKQRWWASAETFQDSVNIQQRKVWQFLPRQEVKYGAYDEINGFTNRKILFKNGTLLTFKSYDQGREAFQGDDCDGIWNDEEPPYDIYKEQRLRLVDRNGEMIFTMTSLKGITDLLADVFEEHTVIRSQYAPLVDKELPRIIEKNGMRFYMLWTTENPYINQKRVLFEAKLMTKEEIMARIYGIPKNLTGKIYMKFNKDIHVISREEIDLFNCQIWNILDPHDRKPWAIQWWAVHKTGSACCFEEYPQQNFNEMLYDDKTYDDYANMIKARESVFMKEIKNKFIKRIIDPNFGNKTMQLAERQGGQSKTTPKVELKKRGLIYSDGIDALEAGHLKVREFLHWEEKDNEIIVQPKAFICDNCTNTITHLARYSRKDINTPDGDVKDKVAPQEKYKDFADTTRYFCMANPRYIIQTEYKPQGKKVY